jgi:dinuclear metal center YbgI/SA1388 family protein
MTIPPVQCIGRYALPRDRVKPAAVRMSTAEDIARFLDRELRVESFTDSSHNGLQVAKPGPVRRVACGVDASLEFFRAARQAGADFLVCHHGISWGDSLRRLTDNNYQRVSFLIENKMALYACHLPLDAHPRLGNNARICRALGLRGLQPFGSYHGTTLGFRGRLARPVAYSRFKRQVERLMDNRIHSMDFGPASIRTVGVVSGGGADLLAEAGAAGLDVFVSGEPKLAAYSLAQELGINAVFAGHYATERFGVEAVGRRVRARFGIPAELINLHVTF